MTENKAVFALGAKISDLRTKNGSILGSLQKVKARAVDTERDLEKAQETITISNSRTRTLTEKVSSLKEEFPSVVIERVNLCADPDEMAAFVPRMKNYVETSLFVVSAEVQKEDLSRYG